MTVTVLLFGIAKEITGNNKLDLDVAEGLTVEELKHRLRKLYPEFVSLKSFAIAVNNHYAGDEVVIHQRDEIAVIPPVSGG